MSDTEDLRPINSRTGEVLDISLIDDLADVLSAMVVGWENVIGHDLSQHPSVVRVMARYRAYKAENNAILRDLLDRPVAPDIVLPPQPHKMVCPVCGLTRHLPEGWQEMVDSDTIRCVTDGVDMVEEIDGISPEQNKRYVLELAALLAHMEEGTKAFAQCLKDLRTSVAFMEADPR